MLPRPSIVLTIGMLFIPILTIHAATEFQVINNGFTSYIIDDENNPSITLQRDSTYIFHISAPGHPFWIKTANSTGTGNAYSAGVTGNGTSQGDVQFTVPSDAPDQLFYNCQFHSPMTGTITIEGPLGGASGLEQDSLALVALYDSTDGANWSNPWDLNSLVSTWNGVTVSGGRVTELNMGGNNMSGTFPAEIGNLDSLTSLSLAGNQLTGAIPAEIGNLANLTWLNLFENQLTGAIPVEIGGLTGLTTVELSFNQLTGTIPAEIGNLTNLNWLFLSHNQLTGTVPVEIGSLTSLTQLAFYDNQLTGAIPVDFGNLTSLTVLLLFNNQLVDLPDLSWISTFTSLQVDKNQLTFEDLEPNVGITGFVIPAHI